MKIIEWIKENKMLVLIIAIGAVLRFYKVDKQSVWVDEIFSLNQSDPAKSLSEIYIYLRNYDPHPPLFYFSLHFVFLIFGYSTFVMKCYTALLGVSGLFAVYFLGKDLAGKRVGLIATVLTVVNYFHLYYSQEGRMYSMLFLTTTLSFLYLVRFIRQPNMKAVLLYTLWTALMIYTHFFGLFALCSQCVILLFYVWNPPINRKKFLGYCSLSAILVLLLYVPALLILFQNTKRTSMWIPTPTVDVLTQIVKEFFGQSEIVLFFIVLLFALLFIKVSSKKAQRANTIDPKGDPQIFSFVILIMWILLTFLVPLVLSFVNLPMLISRYLINILPAIIVLIAMGLGQIKNKAIQLAILSCFVVFSLTDIIVVKKYYRVANKTQFRELSEFVFGDIKPTEPFVSSLAMYFPFFVKDMKNKPQMIEKSLDDYATEMASDPQKIKPFWYADAHIRPYNPTDQTKAFLSRHFVVDKSIDLYDSWGKHYILKSQYRPSVDIADFKPFKPANGDGITQSIEVYNDTANEITLSGWAFLNEQDAWSSTIQLLAIKDNAEVRVLPTEGIDRHDVTTYFKGNFNLDKSGYKCTLLKADFEVGNYKIALLISDDKTGRKGLVLTDKTFSITR